MKDAVLRTLTAICQGGIYDHLGGGFARYSVDARWLVPHFEKMLYDNAQLIDLLVLVWQETKSPLYAARIAETCDWTVREMTAGSGGFAPTIFPLFQGVRFETASVTLRISIMLTSSNCEAGHFQLRYLPNPFPLSDHWRRTRLYVER